MIDSFLCKSDGNFSASILLARLTWFGLGLGSGVGGRFIQYKIKSKKED